LSVARPLHRFGPIDRPISLPEYPEFIERLKRVANGWAISPWEGNAMPPAVSVAHEGGAYVISSPKLKTPWRYADDADAICMFLLELLGAYADNRPDLFFLHAGAALLNDVLVVFPASGHAGKSTLIAALGAAGATIWADDAFPISLDRRTGSALGIAPRPRRPWPVSFSDPTRTFLDQHIATANEQFAYIALPDGRQAPLGTERRIGTFVLPERVEQPKSSHRIELDTASRAETMARLIGQYLGKPPPAHDMVEKLAALLASVPCLRLKYAEADMAADYLLSHPICCA
jgi:hypothetical protein